MSPPVDGAGIGPAIRPLLISLVGLPVVTAVARAHIDAASDGAADPA